MKKYSRQSFAAVLIGALRVKAKINIWFMEISKIKSGEYKIMYSVNLNNLLFSVKKRPLNWHIPNSVISL